MFALKSYSDIVPYVTHQISSFRSENVIRVSLVLMWSWRNHLEGISFHLVYLIYSSLNDFVHIFTCLHLHIENCSHHTKYLLIYGIKMCRNQQKSTDSNMDHLLECVCTNRFICDRGQNLQFALIHGFILRLFT